jgi:uncharacterized protein (TIGR02145 family)/LPXTG-motif cell wall-anchored protein
MNQSLTQTITVTTAPVPGVPNTGFLANTGENLPLFAAIGGILLMLSAIIFVVWLRRRPHARKLRGFFSLIGAVGIVGALIASTTHFASAAASLTLTPQNSTISVAQGSSVQVPTTATLHATSTAGYTLTLVQAQSATGVTASVKTDNTGNVATDTAVTASPLALKTSTAPTAGSGDTVNATLTIAASASATPGTSDLKLTYELTETPVPVPTTMQAMTKAYCTNSMTTYDGTNDSAILTLNDPRGGNGGQNYHVAKLADGNCWMLDNLKLGSTTATTTLTPADSNVASNFTLPQLNNGTRTPDYTANPGNDYDTPYAYGPVTGDTGTGATNYGYLYNWSAATAGETRTSMPGDGTNDDIAPHSICAAGWRLPTGGDYNTGQGEFAALDQAFGGTGMDVWSGESNIAKWQSDGPFKGTFAGYWNGGFYVQGSFGFLWSRSAGSGDAGGALGAGFGSGEVTPGGVGGRYGGFGVRCLLQ